MGFPATTFREKFSKCCENLEKLSEIVQSVAKNLQMLSLKRCELAQILWILKIAAE